MWKRTLGLGALLGGLLTAPLIGLMYLANQLAELPFVPFDFFDWMTRVLPGGLITFGIDTMINLMLFLNINVADSAKTAEQLVAVLQFWVGGVVAGILFFALLGSRRVKATLANGLVLGALFGLPLVLISLVIGQSAAALWLKLPWLAALFLGWGVAFTWAASKLLAPAGTPTTAEPAAATPTSEPAPAGVVKLNRRQFLVRLGAGAATITVLSAGLGATLASAERRRLAATAPPTDLVNGQPVLPNANDPVIPAPGTRPEYTPIADHYKVFLRTEPTLIEEEDWVLPITGLVDNPLMLTLADIRERYTPREQFVTLSCISGRVGTTLISTTKWSGVSVQEVLRDAGLQANARYLFITGGDGFYETVDLDLINQDERIMFCYAWDDKPLPKDHGFPLRIWIPDRFGMKQPKWITGIEVTDTYTPGYWVERNWDEVAQVKATSVIDTVAVNDVYEENGQQMVPVGGIAWAGDRGISRVEVRVDEGPWQEARLRSPLSETTWVIWRYDWPFTPGRHTFEVRCAEADGTPQIEEEQPIRPSGATGIDQFEVRA